MILVQEAADSDETRRAVFDSYIKSYTTYHPADSLCIRCLYERAVTTGCLDQNLWIQYANYLVRVLNKPDSALCVSLWSYRLLLGVILLFAAVPVIGTYNENLRYLTFLCIFIGHMYIIAYVSQLNRKLSEIG